MKHLILILLMAMGLEAHADYDAAAAERKSDWYFMEALRQRALGHGAMYYSMMGRAAQLSPDPADRAVFERSIQDLFLSQAVGDTLGVADALRRAETYFRANPSDTYAGSYLARVNAEQGNGARTEEIYAILEREKPNDISIVANHAEYLLHINRLDDAVELYRSLERTMGRNAQLTQRIANIRAWQGDTLGALAEVDSLIAAYPRSVESLHLGAVAAGALDRPDLVLSYTDRAMAIDPSNGLTYYYAANAYNELGRTREYADAVRSALAGDDLDASDKTEILRYYAAQEASDTPDETLTAMFASMVEQYPQDYDVRKLYFAYLISHRDFEGAAEQLQSAINIDPQYPDDFDTLARVYASMDDYARAQDLAQEGIDRFPDAVEFTVLKSSLQHIQNQFADAAETIKGALATNVLTDTDSSQLYGTLGDLAQNDASIGNPGEYYEKALELDRFNHLAMNNYAYWLSTSGGDLVKAKDLISKALLYNSESATYLDTMAWVCYKLGQIDEAKKYIDKALTADADDPDMADGPNMAEMLQHAGDIYNRAGEKEKARAYWKRAKALDPDITSE